MKRFFAGLLALGLCPMPAMAQDLPSQYAAAYSAFQSTNISRDALAQRQLIAQTLLDLSGNWFNASVVIENDPVLTPDVVAQVCDSRGKSVLTAPTPYQFVMTQTDNQGNTLSRHFDYVNSHFFQLRVDDLEFATYLRLTDKEELMAQQLSYSAGRFGMIAMFHPSPDILVLQSAYGPPEIHVRCPT